MRTIILLFFSIFVFYSSIAQSYTLTFSSTCVKGNSILIAAVGDVLLHKPLQNKAAREGFQSLWQSALPFIKTADIAYANLEGPMAFGIDEKGRDRSLQKQYDNNQIYTGFPMFNYHPSLAGALKDSGFDIVSTANNHALDRYSIGVDKTITALNKAGLTYVGSRSTFRDGALSASSQVSNEKWVQIIYKKGFSVAWIACTEMTNGFIDRHKQILYCYKEKDKKFILNKIAELKSSVDAIIVTPHWGEEYQTYPNRTQINFAHAVLEAGATAVIGSHPHVLQPLQKYLTRDGRETLIMYSLGNFVSYQNKPHTRNTIILFFGLTKTANGVVINGIHFVPMYMQNGKGVTNLQLTPLNPNNITSSQSRILPMGNAIYSPPTSGANLSCENN